MNMYINAQHQKLVSILPIRRVSYLILLVVLFLNVKLICHLLRSDAIFTHGPLEQFDYISNSLLYLFFLCLKCNLPTFFVLSLKREATLPFDVLLTTYDVAILDQDFLSQVPWQFAVIDEAQRLKNPSSVCIFFPL